MLIYDDIRFQLNNLKPKLDDLKLALIFFVSACFHILSKRLIACYILADYADALLRCLRPCCAVLGLGAIALQRLDSKEKEE